MARTKAEPKPTFAKVRLPPRAILISDSVTAFCAAVYALGLSPADTWRALSREDAEQMQERWNAKGIGSYVVPLADVMKGGETADDESESPAVAA